MSNGQKTKLATKTRRHKNNHRLRRLTQILFSYRGRREHRETSPQAFEKRLTGQSRICPRYESFDGARDRVSAVRFSALPLGWVLPAGGEVIVQAEEQGWLGIFAQRYKYISVCVYTYGVL
jgi:hypothetical protein